jgi:hypothetical protein
MHASSMFRRFNDPYHHWENSRLSQDLFELFARQILTWFIRTWPRLEFWDEWLRGYVESQYVCTRFMVISYRDTSLDEPSG